MKLGKILYRHRVCTTVVSSIVSFLLLWVADNSRYTVGNETLLMKGLHLTSLFFEHKEPVIPGDYLAVNISYDRQLTPLYGEYDIPLGDIDVTHRGRLYDFLRAIEGADYRAVVLDVLFDARTPAEGDTALFAQINRMSRLVVPTHQGAEVSPLIAGDRVASDDYSANPLESNFVKYPYGSVGGVPSIAELVGVYCGCPAARFFDLHSLVLPLHINAVCQYDSQGRQQWYNLGAELLDEDVYSAEELRALVRGRIIVLGDYAESDSHDTYIGTVSGPVILINAIDAYLRGATRPNLWAVLLILITLTCISYMLVYDMPGRLKLGRKSERWLVAKCPRFVKWCRDLRLRHPEVWVYLRKLFHFSVLLVVLQVLLYYVFDQFHDPTLLAAYLAFFAYCCQKINSKYSNS